MLTLGSYSKYYKQYTFVDIRYARVNSSLLSLGIYNLIQEQSGN